MDCNLTSQTEKGLNLKLATFQQLFNLMHPFEGKVFFFFKVTNMFPGMT